MKLVLASKSFTRRMLLQSAGIAVECDAADIDEERIGQSVTDPSARALALAQHKALWVAKRHPGRVVLGGDQVGVCDGRFLDKPSDPAEHVEMLLRMAGRTHTFYPAAVLVKDDVVLGSAAESVTVYFRAFDRTTAAALVATGEGAGSCGGYESENRGAQLILRVDGSMQAVLGLPLLGVLHLLRDHAPHIEGLI